MMAPPSSVPDSAQTRAGESNLDATRLQEILEIARHTPGPRVVLTGAGISAESGIPTFRGAEGYWQVGSRNYQPSELATLRAFTEMPAEIWAWYLYRRAVCRAALPNDGHRALAELEATLGDRFLLITQNVDGLHLRAGNSQDRTYQIHGNLDFTRCSAGCHIGVDPLPDELSAWRKDQALDAASRELLHCPHCGAWLRPHVLWFDECYDEVRYRFESSLSAAESCGILLIVGTSGATNLPMQVAARVAERGAPLIVVDPEPSPFTDMAEASPAGCFAQGLAGEWVPQICAELANKPVNPS